VPIEPGVHVADCGVPRPEDTEAAPEHEYGRVPAEIGRLLDRPDEQRMLRQAAATYFDDHATPARVASSVLERLPVR
jgi:hypothetical protein